MNRRLLAALLASMPACAALAQSFQEGHVYLVSSGLPKPPNAFQAGVMRIDPSDWSTSVISTTSLATVGRATYDSLRDRLVLRTQAANGPLTLLAADGTTTTLAYAGPQDAIMPAASGDGRVYFIHSATKGIAYVDIQGATHDVSEGLTPVATINPNTWVSYFDYLTNSLYLGQYNSTGPRNRVEKITMNATGDHVVSRATVDFSVPNASIENIVSLGAGPNGTIFVKVDDNTNNAASRMQVLDPMTMTVSPYATSGYFGVAAEVAGCYSAAADAALVLDTGNDLLRKFTLGSNGPGTVVAGGVSSSGGSGEAAQLIPIVKVCIADVNRDGFVTGDDADLFNDWFTAGDMNADFDHNGFVNGDDFDAFMVRFDGGC